MNNQEDKELIARIRSTSLSGTETDVGELMYQCGFAAGQIQTLQTRHAKRYQLIGSAAAVALLGFSLGRFERFESRHASQTRVAQDSISSSPHTDLTNRDADVRRSNSLLALRANQADSLLMNSFPVGISSSAIDTGAKMTVLGPIKSSDPLMMN